MIIASFSFEEGSVKSFYRFLVSVRGVLVVLVLLSMVPVGLALRGLRSNNAVDTFLAEDDPALAFYREVSDTFGGDRVVFLAIEAKSGSILEGKRLDSLSRISDELGMLSVVGEVTSLTTARSVVQIGDTISPGALGDNLPLSADDLARLNRRVRSSPLFGALVSDDLSSSVIVLALAWWYLNRKDVRRLFRKT